MDAVRHWPPRSRSAFLVAVAEQLRGRDDIGDGELDRVIRLVAGAMEEQRASWLSP
jgi:hypothetical protein